MNQENFHFFNFKPENVKMVSSLCSYNKDTNKIYFQNVNMSMEIKQAN